MKELLAVGSGGANRVLHGFAVPVHKEMVFGFHTVRTICLSFSGFQQFSLLF